MTMSPEVEVNGGFEYTARAAPRAPRRNSEQILMRLA